MRATRPACASPHRCLYVIGGCFGIRELRVTFSPNRRWILQAQEPFCRALERPAEKQNSLSARYSAAHPSKPSPY